MFFQLEIYKFSIIRSLIFLSKNYCAKNDGKILLISLEAIDFRKKLTFRYSQKLGRKQFSSGKSTEFDYLSKCAVCAINII